MTLNYYLYEAQKGNAQAAFEAGRLMEADKYNPVLVQKQYRKAASMGYAPAQRWLGILALCNALIDEKSTVSSIHYNKNSSDAIDWFVKASKNGDAVSSFIIGKCYQCGIGVEVNEFEADRILSEFADKVGLGMSIAIMMLFQGILQDNGNHLPPANSSAIVSVFNPNALAS